MKQKHNTIHRWTIFVAKKKRMCSACEMFNHERIEKYGRKTAANRATVGNDSATGTCSQFNSSDGYMSDPGCEHFQLASELDKDDWKQT